MPLTTFYTRSLAPFVHPAGILDDGGQTFMASRSSPGGAA